MILGFLLCKVEMVIPAGIICRIAVKGLGLILNQVPQGLAALKLLMLWSHLGYLEHPLLPTFTLPHMSLASRKGPAAAPLASELWGLLGCTQYGL